MVTPGLAEDLSHSPGLFPAFNSMTLSWFWGDSSVPHVGVSPEPGWIPPGPMARTVLLADVLPARGWGWVAGFFYPWGRKVWARKKSMWGVGWWLSCSAGGLLNWSPMADALLVCSGEGAGVRPHSQAPYTS